MKIQWFQADHCLVGLKKINDPKEFYCAQFVIHNIIQTIGKIRIRMSIIMMCVYIY